jgi:hypothetical protein
MYDAAVVARMPRIVVENLAAQGVLAVFSESLIISECKRNSVTECIEKVIFSLVLFVTNPKAFNLIGKMVS